MKIPLSNDKWPSSWELCTSLLPRQLAPTTQDPTTFPAWSPLDSSSASSTANKQSAPATAGRPNSVLSWTLCSLSGIFSSPRMSPPRISARPPKFLLPSTMRRIPSAVRTSQTYFLSTWQPAQSRQASTSSSAYATGYVILPPHHQFCL